MNLCPQAFHKQSVISRRLGAFESDAGWGGNKSWEIQNLKVMSRFWRAGMFPGALLGNWQSLWTCSIREKQHFKWSWSYLIRSRESCLQMQWEQLCLSKGTERGASGCQELSTRQADGWMDRKITTQWWHWSLYYSDIIVYYQNGKHWELVSTISYLYVYSEFVLSPLGKSSKKLLWSTRVLLF